MRARRAAGAPEGLLGCKVLQLPSLGTGDSGEHMSGAKASGQQGSCGARLGFNPVSGAACASLCCTTVSEESVW